MVSAVKKKKKLGCFRNGNGEKKNAVYVLSDFLNVFFFFIGTFLPSH